MRAPVVKDVSDTCLEREYGDTRDVTPTTSRMSEPRAGRQINQLRILNALRRQPGLSRVAIARQTGLGKATVSNLVAGFIDTGLICEVGRDVQTATAGRRPVKLELNGDAYFAIGIELTGKECVGALTDLRARPLRNVSLPMPGTFNEVIDTAAQIVAELLSGRDKTKLLGVAVGVPGVVDSALKHITMAEHLGWTDVPLGTLLQERISVPVSLVNRANAGALGEYWHGAGRGVDNLIYVSISVGIGAGIIINGMLYEGTNGSAGEIGHVAVELAGHRCKCGNTGCLETLASSPAIVVSAQQRLKAGEPSLLHEWTDGKPGLITAEMVSTAAAEGDSVAVRSIEEAAHYLGMALANVINLFNPALIIVDGDILEFSDVFLESVRQTVNRKALSIPLTAVHIVPSMLRHLAGAIGASAVAIDRFFALPSDLAPVASARTNFGGTA